MQKGATIDFQSTLKICRSFDDRGRNQDTILNQPDVADPSGMRDGAILEVLYSTSLRRMEIANLKLHDLDSDRG